jgi:hypothetical protein
LVTPISVEITELNTDDNYFPSFANNQTYFEMKTGTSFNYSNLGGGNAIMIQMSPNKTIISRKVYSMQDLLNEIGGFVQVLDIMFRIVIPLF